MLADQHPQRRHPQVQFAAALVLAFRGLAIGGNGLCQKPRRLGIGRPQRRLFARAFPFGRRHRRLTRQTTLGCHDVGQGAGNHRVVRLDHIGDAAMQCRALAAQDRIIGGFAHQIVAKPDGSTELALPRHQNLCRQQFADPGKGDVGGQVTDRHQQVQWKFAANRSGNRRNPAAMDQPVQPCEQGFRQGHRQMHITVTVTVTVTGTGTGTGRQPATGQFFGIDRHPIGPGGDGLCHLWRHLARTRQPRHQGHDLLCGQPVQCQHRQAGLPPRQSLGPCGPDHRGCSGQPGTDRLHHLCRRGVEPLRIFQHQHPGLTRQRLHQLGKPLQQLAAQRGGTKAPQAGGIVCHQPQKPAHQCQCHRVIQPRRTQQVLQPGQGIAGALARRHAGALDQQVAKRVQCQTGMVGRTLQDQRVVQPRLCQGLPHQPRFADAGITGDHQRVCTTTPQMQRKRAAFGAAPDKVGLADRQAQRLEPADGGRAAGDLPDPLWLCDPLHRRGAAVDAVKHRTNQRMGLVGDHQRTGLRQCLNARRKVRGFPHCAQVHAAGTVILPHHGGAGGNADPHLRRYRTKRR